MSASTHSRIEFEEARDRRAGVERGEPGGRGGRGGGGGAGGGGRRRGARCWGPSVECARRARTTARAAARGGRGGAGAGANAPRAGGRGGRRGGWGAPARAAGRGEPAGEVRDPLSDELIDELLAGARSEEEIVGPGGLLADLTRRLVERAMAAELTEHMGYERHAEPPGGTGNTRSGTTPKTLQTEHGPVQIRQPRDRDGSFEPPIVRKGQRRFEGFDDKIVARGGGGG